MDFRIAVFACLLTGVLAFPQRFANYQTPDSSEEYGYGQDTPYDFWWAVSSEDHYDRKLDFGHHETRGSDERVEGFYYVLLPNSVRQTVTYYVDKDSGFVAKVENEGTPIYPESSNGYQQSSKKY